MDFEKLDNLIEQMLEDINRDIPDAPEISRPSERRRRRGNRGKQVPLDSLAQVLTDSLTGRERREVRGARKISMNEWMKTIRAKTARQGIEYKGGVKRQCAQIEQMKREKKLMPFTLPEGFEGLIDDNTIQAINNLAGEVCKDYWPMVEQCLDAQLGIIQEFDEDMNEMIAFNQGVVAWDPDENPYLDAVHEIEEIMEVEEAEQVEETVND